MGIILIVLSFFLTKKFLFPMANLLITNGAVKKNYLGKEIPVAMGLVIWLGALPSLLIYEKLNNSYVLILTITLLVGFIDDLLGNHSVKGLKGHMLRLIKKEELTSGALKALIISLISFFITGTLSGNYIQWMINFFLLILTTNSFNLLDVRPGRAIKGFILVAVILFSIYPASRYFLSILIASIIAYAPWDFKAKGMLGDTGSNFLGMSIGLVLVIHLALIYKIIILLLLIYLHIYTEQKSLSALIEKIYILRLLDNLGR